MNDSGNPASNILCCPVCHGELRESETDLGMRDCEGCGQNYRINATNKLVLLPPRSVFVEKSNEFQAASPVRRRPVVAQKLGMRIKRIVFPSTSQCRTARQQFVTKLTSSPQISKILIVGGATVGNGVDAIIHSPALESVVIDVYDTDVVDYIADAHSLPFKSEQFDGVWIQAVLEHVIDPVKVCSEITRVLKKKGVLYSEVPFLQDVHEGAYDFTRFTLSGHRNLFRNFIVLAHGSVDEGHVQMCWAIRSYVRTIPMLSLLETVAFYGCATLLRLLVMFQDKEKILDSASSTFLLGEKSTVMIKDDEVISFYGRQGKQ
jgi:SAM-dependent methyltransferase